MTEPALRRSRKGSSNEGSRHSRTSSHSGNPSEEEVKIPVPGATDSDGPDCTLTNTTLQSPGNATLLSNQGLLGTPPGNQGLLGTSPTIYTGIMSSLTAEQCIVFINDHINAVADTAAIETLHQVI